MGKEVADAFPAARAVFDEADDALGFSISELCFEGPADDLTLTEYSQPAILTTSIAILRALEAEHDVSFEVAMGHSLGEYSALVAVGALSLSDAVRLVHLRGKAMQKAVPVGEGGMAALLGLDFEAVSALCQEFRGGRVLAPANINGGGQSVVSGHRDAIERLVAEARDRGAKRAIMLQVSAPFHCSLMQPAAERVAEALESIEIHPLKVPVISNVEATLNSDAGRVKELLVKQVTAPVRWEASMLALTDLGVDKAFELGEGSVLRGLARRIVQDLPVQPVGDPAAIREWSK